MMTRPNVQSNGLCGVETNLSVCFGPEAWTSTKMSSFTKSVQWQARAPVSTFKTDCSSDTKPVCDTTCHVYVWNVCVYS